VGVQNLVSPSLPVLAHSDFFESWGGCQSWHSCHPIFGRCPKIALGARTPRYARGCTAVGVDEICRQVGVHKGSFYHCFPSKQGLVLAVLAM